MPQYPPIYYMYQCKKCMEIIHIILFTLVSSDGKGKMREVGSDYYTFPYTTPHWLTYKECYFYNWSNELLKQILWLQLYFSHTHIHKTSHPCDKSHSVIGDLPITSFISSFCSNVTFPLPAGTPFPPTLFYSLEHLSTPDMLHISPFHSVVACFLLLECSHHEDRDMGSVHCIPSSQKSAWLTWGAQQYLLNGARVRKDGRGMWPLWPTVWGHMQVGWGSGDKLVNPDPGGIFRVCSAASFLNVLRLLVCGFRRHLMEIRLRG